MKVGLQIYVIYFLIPVKMKKIVSLFVTLSGICTALAQKPAYPSIPDNTGQTKGNDSTTIITKPTVRLYPNPAANKIEIEIKGFEPGFVQVLITDHAGKPAREERRLVLSSHEAIAIMFSLKSGIYFLVVKQGKRLARSKLVIQ